MCKITVVILQLRWNAAGKYLPQDQILHVLKLNCVMQFALLSTTSPGSEHDDGEELGDCNLDLLATGRYESAE